MLSFFGRALLSQLDGGGARSMEKQQEIASKQAFKERLLKDIAINTGSNLFDLRSESHHEMRTDRIREFITPMRSLPEIYDMTGGDDFTPFDTPSSPFYETPALSDYSSRINRRIDFDEQEEIQALNRQQHKREQTVQGVSQQLDQSQPRRRVDVDIKTLTRNYLDRLYLNTVDKVQVKADLKHENERVDKSSGSRDQPKYGNPESSVEPKGKAGRPSKYMKSDEMFWKIRSLKPLLMNLTQ